MKTNIRIISLFYLVSAFLFMTALFMTSKTNDTSYFPYNWAVVFFLVFLAIHVASFVLLIIFLVKNRKER